MTRPLLEPPFVSSAPPPNYHPSPTTATSSGNWWPYSGAKDFKSNIFVIVIFLVCALVCGLAINWTIRFFFRWWKADQREEAKGPTSVALQRRPPPTLVYSSGAELAGVDAACAICLSEFADGERVRVLPSCRHGFHVKCIEAWLASHASCPTCRAEADPEMPLPVPAN
ncbi:RING-H2 finger protein ATL79-like [Nymphaea colorata]|uniref:RING-type domain-containing protein n=1 Tax=Nymphaea colorata TaxID=210225 RepID=A0A5K1GZ08_9MAGN|nr:RING-H2 finger protein ATL79-like [Nymphaea colorata]